MGENVTMNPKVSEHWEQALTWLKVAKNSLENGESDKIVKNNLVAAICYGFLAMKEACFDIGLLPAATATEAMNDIERLSGIQAIERSREALNEYRNFVPKEYYLPEPI